MWKNRTTRRFYETRQKQIDVLSSQCTYVCGFKWIITGLNFSVASVTWRNMFVMIGDLSWGKRTAQDTPILRWFVPRLVYLAFSELLLTSHDVIDASNIAEHVLWSNSAEESRTRLRTHFCSYVISRAIFFCSKESIICSFIISVQNIWAIFTCIASVLELWFLRVLTSPSDSILYVRVIFYCQIIELSVHLR